MKNKEVKQDQILKNVDDYLESLKIELKIKIDKVDEIDRVHQLINKTNQFNFTTTRYSKNEVHNIYNSKKNSLISVKVKDKFGDSGITGIIILYIIMKKFTLILFY